MKIKRILAVALCAIVAMPLVACGDETKNEVGTVNIMIVNAGYGTGFIEDVADVFNETYKEQGYKINVLEPRSTFQGTSALNEMRLGTKTGYDIVITSGVSVQQATDENFGVCVEDLNDVYDSYPINFDGTEGDTKIKDLVNKDFDWQLKIGDTYWSLPYATSSRGLVCNVKVLKSYGINELPVTTNDLFKMMNTVYNGTAQKTGMRPMTWGGANAYGYVLPSLYTSIAQMMGTEAYDAFFKLNYLLNDDGTIKADGYECVDNPAIKSAIKVVMQEFDSAYSIEGAVTQKHTNAHAQLITGKAAFMFDGEFFYNEVKTSFSKYLGDIRFASLPIMSQLGIDLKLDGSGNDADKCDEILAFMAKKVDEGKTAAEIKTLAESEFAGITFTDEQVARVVEARTTGNGGISPLYIIKDSVNADIAKMFLRMLLSEDAAPIYAKYGMIHPLYSSSAKDGIENQFIKDAYAVNSMYVYNTTSTLYPGSVRSKTNMFLIPPYNAMFAVTLKDEMGSVSNPSQRDYASLADKTFSKITENVKKNWASIVGNGGYKVG